MKLIYFLFLFLFLSFSFALAIGASPASAKSEYYEGYSENFVFGILNNGQPNTYVELTLNGDLAKFVTLSEDSFIFGSNRHSVNLEINLPSYEEIGIYGKQRVYLKAAEHVQSDGMFSVSTAVAVWVEIYIPTPGSFAEVESLNPKNTFEGDDTSVSFVLVNRGTDDLTSTSAKLLISDFEGDVVDQINLRNINIPVGEKLSFDEDIYSSKYDSGKYFLTLDYFFDDGFIPATMQESFFVGSSDIILSDYSFNLTEGKINKINFKVQSLWGSNLDNVLLSLFYDGVSHPLPSLTFQPFELKSFDGFLEAPLIEDKKIDSIPLDAKLIISIPRDNDYFDKEIPLSFTVLQEKNNSSFNISSTALLIIGGVLLVIIIVVTNVVLLSRVKKKK